jgi:hypothetical protein
MGTFKHVSDITSVCVFDICRVKNVAVGVVTATSMRLVRALLEARYLLARLVGRMGGGQLALAKCQTGSAASPATWAHRPSCSAGAHLRRPERLSRPWSAGGQSRF